VNPFRWASRVYWKIRMVVASSTMGITCASWKGRVQNGLRSLGFSQLELAKEPGVLFAVVSLNIEYRRPARLDDELVNYLRAGHRRCGH